MRLFLAVLVLFLYGASGLHASPTVSTVELMGRKFTAYKVDKKESLYAISRSLGLDYDSLSSWNIGIGGEVPKGYTLYMPQEVAGEKMTAPKAERVIKYTVKPGETLYGIAKKYNTTVEDIIELNPRLRSSVLPADAVIQVCENSADKTRQAVEEMREGIVAFRYYLVSKDESPEGIARSAGISQELLKAVNPGVTIKRKAALAIPVIGHVPYVVYRHVADSRESTAEGQQSIFDSIAEQNHDEGQVICVLLSNPKTNKDVDFSRGLLTAVHEFGKGNRYMDIKFVNGEENQGDLLSNPAIEKADIIFTTYEANIPVELADYAARHGKTLVNAFAVRDSLYRTNRAMVNLLSSPLEFNAQTAQYINENFANSYIVFIGDPLKANDQIALKVMNGIDPENFDVVESIADVVPHPSRPMVFYSLANNKKDMKTHLDEIAAWMTANPGIDVNTIGRPSWIVYADTYSDELKNVHANLPTRFYFPDKDDAPQQFIKKYHDFFKADPVRSYPAYSVMGYDAAWYFLRPGAEHDYLQMPFRLTRVSNGGEYNSAAFMLRYFPGMPVTKFDMVPYMQISSGNAN